MIGPSLRVLATVVALVVLFVAPVWTETGRGYAVVPIWWPQESGVSRSLIGHGALIDVLAIAAVFSAVVWPWLITRHRRR